MKERRGATLVFGVVFCFNAFKFVYKEEQKMAKEYWVKCEISPGMFSSERAICITDINGEQKSGFVHESFIDEKNGLVKVELYSSDENNALLVCNPSWEMFASRNIVVLKSQIVEKEIPD